MSEYQYYEFCSLTKPMSQAARKEMQSLSSRTNITTHGAAYEYTFGGGFRGDPEKLLLKYFDIYFYIANWGTVKLMFKFLNDQVDIKELKSYLINDVISCKKHGKYILLNIEICKEEGFGWTEGQGILPILLPLYTEILNKNYQFLQLAGAVNNEFTGEARDSLADIKDKYLTEAYQEFINCTGFA